MLPVDLVVSDSGALEADLNGFCADQRQLNATTAPDSMILEAFLNDFIPTPCCTDSEWACSLLNNAQLRQSNATLSYESPLPELTLSSSVSSEKVLSACGDILPGWPMPPSFKWIMETSYAPHQEELRAADPAEMLHKDSDILMPTSQSQSMSIAQIYSDACLAQRPQSTNIVPDNIGTALLARRRVQNRNAQRRYRVSRKARIQHGEARIQQLEDQLRQVEAQNSSLEEEKRNLKSLFSKVTDFHT